MPICQNEGRREGGEREGFPPLSLFCLSTNASSAESRTDDVKNERIAFFVRATVDAVVMIVRPEGREKLYLGHAKPLGYYILLSFLAVKCVNMITFLLATPAGGKCSELKRGRCLSLGREGGTTDGRTA